MSPKSSLVLLVNVSIYSAARHLCDKRLLFLQTHGHVGANTSHQIARLAEARRNPLAERP